MIVDRKYWEEISYKAGRKRRFETVDLVERMYVITSSQIRIKNHPVNRPRSVFNPSMKITENGIRIYARVTLGYYTYASAVAEFDVSFEDLYSKRKKEFTADLTILPSTRYDFWGVEDPRVYEIEGNTYVTYCGRTVSYFDSHIRVERTLPITAVFRNGRWEKIAVFRMPDEIRSFVISDKNAFMVKAKDLLLFHRIHMLNEKFYLSVCKIPEGVLNLDHFEEVIVGDNITVLEEQTDFEAKLGWATPPVRVNDEFLVLIHAVDKVMGVYRVFAVLMNDEGLFTAVTPFYIMEPREIYEIYGDRPYVVFPCGAGLKDGYLYISYGGADSVVGIGRIKLDKLLEILYENRIE
ncbi:MAG: glycosidase [Aquificota bacterium]|nr:glycosidase [Aquificota bacterium]